MGPLKSSNSYESFAWVVWLVGTLAPIFIPYTMGMTKNGRKTAAEIFVIMWTLGYILKFLVPDVQVGISFCSEKEENSFKPAKVRRAAILPSLRSNFQWLLCRLMEYLPLVLVAFSTL